MVLQFRSKNILLYWSQVGGNDRRNRENNSWPKSRGKYLHFVLHKVDADSPAIFAQLKRIIFPAQSENSKAPCKFKIAGLKDRLIISHTCCCCGLCNF